MSNKEKLIECYKASIKNNIKDAVIFKEINFEKKTFSSDLIFINFMENIIGKKEYYRHLCFYKLYEIKGISICCRDLFFDIVKEYDIVKEEKIRKILFYQHKYFVDKYKENQESKERQKWFKDNNFYIIDNDEYFHVEKKLYVITYEDIIFEITTEEFKSLEKLVVDTLIQESISNMDNL